MVEQFGLDDIAIAEIGDSMRIHFGYDQRNIDVVSKVRGVIDNNTTRFSRNRCPFGGNITPAEKNQFELGSNRRFLRREW